MSALEHLILVCLWNGFLAEHGYLKDRRNLSSHSMILHSPLGFATNLEGAYVAWKVVRQASGIATAYLERYTLFNKAN